MGRGAPREHESSHEIPSVTPAHYPPCRQLQPALDILEQALSCLYCCGLVMTLNGDVMTGKELERDVPARLDRLPDGLPFG